MQASFKCLARNHYMYELGTEDSENYQWSKLQVFFFFFFEKNNPLTGLNSIWGYCYI